MCVCVCVCVCVNLAIPNISRTFVHPPTHAHAHARTHAHLSHHTHTHTPFLSRARSFVYTLNGTAGVIGWIFLGLPIAVNCVLAVLFVRTEIKDPRFGPFVRDHSGGVAMVRGWERGVVVLQALCQHARRRALTERMVCEGLMSAQLLALALSSSSAVLLPPSSPPPPPALFSHPIFHSFSYRPDCGVLGLQPARAQPACLQVLWPDIL